MNALDEVLKRVDDAVTRLEKSEPRRDDAAPAMRAEIDGLARRVESALAKARAARAALD